MKITELDNAAVEMENMRRKTELTEKSRYSKLSVLELRNASGSGMGEIEEEKLAFLEPKRETTKQSTNSHGA